MHCLLVVVCWLMSVGCWLFCVVGCLLFGVFVYIALCIVRCSVLRISCYLFVRCSLLVVGCLLRADCC